MPLDPVHAVAGVHQPRRIATVGTRLPRLRGDDALVAVDRELWSLTELRCPAEPHTFEHARVALFQNFTHSPAEDGLRATLAPVRVLDSFCMLSGREAIPDWGV